MPNMEQPRAALLAAKMSGAWPARSVSDMTVTLWAERFSQYPEEISLRVASKAMANLPEPPSSSALRDLLRNDAQTELPSSVAALPPRETGIRCESCDEPMVEDPTFGHLVHANVRQMTLREYVASDWHAKHDPEGTCYFCSRYRHPAGSAMEQIAGLGESVARRPAE